MARYLTRQKGLPKAEEKMLHALGASNRVTYIRHGKEYFRPYRNYFCAGTQGDKDLDAAHKAGYVTRKIYPGYNRDGVFYHVTDEGREHLEEVTGCHIYPEER